MAKTRTIVCNECFEDVKSSEVYKVTRDMHRGYPDMGVYYTYYCEACTELTETYKQIIKKPKKRK
jgi:hypothetical protein